jgi:hypothetical protein
MLQRLRVAQFAAGALAFIAAATLAASVQVKLESIGPRVGTAVPEFEGADQFGRNQTLKSVLGPEGAMIVFYRSADW